MSQTVRHDWQLTEVVELFNQPFNDLLYQAQQVHRQNFVANQVQVSTLLSIKTGACPEDCKYCPQSARYKTGLEVERLMDTATVVANAKAAKEQGASRFCMGAAWRNPRDKDLDKVLDMVKEVKALGMETCMTLGMLSGSQAQKLKQAGLDYYNHNIDTAPDFYPEVISTRTIDDRLETLNNVRAAGMNVCCGGIVGMGEAREHRAGLLITLANLDVHPESVPINRLVQVEGTPLHGEAELDNFEFIRTIAVARILMPKSVVRLSAGRTEMNEEMQALCFLAGANSIFYGEKLLTTENPEAQADRKLFDRLGIEPMPAPCSKKSAAA